MKTSLLIAVATTLVALHSTSMAFEVYQQVNAISVPVLDKDGDEIQPGDFELRVGTFTYNANFALNNTAIQANQNSPTNLAANFQTLFVFGGLEGDPFTYTTGATPVVNADMGSNVGGDGLFYAYMVTDSETTWITNYSSFSNDLMYLWIVDENDSSHQGIFASSLSNFADGSSAITEASATLNLTGATVPVVGINNAGSSLQLVAAVPEPATAGLLIGGLALLAARRRRA